jgi:hypothetical protein
VTSGCRTRVSTLREYQVTTHSFDPSPQPMRQLVSAVLTRLSWPSRTVASSLLVAGWGARHLDVFFLSRSGLPGGGRFSLGVTRVLKPTPAESLTDSLFPLQRVNVPSASFFYEDPAGDYDSMDFAALLSGGIPLLSRRELGEASRYRLLSKNLLLCSECVETVSVTCPPRSLRVASRLGPRHD